MTFKGRGTYLKRFPSFADHVLAVKMPRGTEGRGSDHTVPCCQRPSWWRCSPQKCAWQTALPLT